VALFTLFTISVPLRMGLTPDPGAIRTGDTINSVLSALVALVGVPLGVLVNLGVRFAMLDDQEWRAAFASAWRLTKVNFGSVAVLYLIQVGVGVGVLAVLSMLLGVLVAGTGIAVALLVGAAHTFSGTAMFVTLIAGLLATLVLLVYSVGIIVWASVLWTLFWRRLTGGERAPETRPGYSPVVNGYASGTTG
jgi:hypothetical protein